MKQQLPFDLTLEGALNTHQETLAKIWREAIVSQPELQAIISGPKQLKFADLQTRVFKILQFAKGKNVDFSLALNELFIWLLSERQRLQSSPELIPRIIFLLTETMRSHLLSDDFKVFEKTIDLIGWGFLQRYYSEIVEILMQSNERLEDRVLEHTLELEASNQKIKDWNKTLELNVADRTRDLLIEKHKLTTIIENITEGILVTDFDHQICQINKVAKSILGVKTKKVKELHISSLIESPELLQAVTEALDSGPGAIVSKDFALNLPTSRPQTIRIYSTLAIDDKKEPLGVISVLVDITKETELETAKARFLNTAAHELRTPLTSILGFISLLLEPGMGTLDDTQRDFLDSAYQNGHKLKHLINGLLDLSRVDAGKLTLHKEEVCLNTFLPEILQPIRENAVAKGLKLELIGPKQKKIILPADPIRLQQIIDHLCFNAIKFTEKGTVTVSYCVDGQVVDLTVQDTGPGIAKADQKLIFERFHQIDNSSTKKYEGTGLGLAVTKALVALHAGTIRVESSLGHGAKFIVSLPLG